MALPKKNVPESQNPHATGPNLDVLRADPRVVIHHRPPGVDPMQPVPGIRVEPGVDVLELLGRRPHDKDETDE